MPGSRCSRPRAAAVRFLLAACLAPLLVPATTVRAAPAGGDPAIESLLARMTLEEKVGQMSLRGFSSRARKDPRELQEAVRAGRVGALINVTDAEASDSLQRLAVEESRLGIP